MPWLVHHSELTDEQRRAVALGADEHRLIFGGPGSGKTQVLLHRAAFLRDTYDIPSERYRIFVFTNALKQYISSAMSFLDLAEENILTFDDWCYQFFTENINARVPRNQATKQPAFNVIRGMVREFLQTAPRLPLYDCILVDEGQDLDPEAFDIIRRIGRHITVCMDNKQQIYEQGSSESEILQRLNMRRRNVALLSTYRCCPYIAQLASHLISDPETRQQYLNQTRTEQVVRQKPLLYVSADEPDEMGRLVEIIKDRQMLGDKIAILYPTRRLVYGYAQGLANAGLEVEVPGQRGRRIDQYRPLDFTSDLPKIMPYHSAKGLTFDSVIMPRLEPRAFGAIPLSSLSRLLFVGITRASKWVYLSSRKGDVLPLVHELEKVCGRDCLEVQFKDEGRGMGDDLPPAKSAGGFDDLL